MLSKTACLFQLDHWISQEIRLPDFVRCDVDACAAFCLKHLSKTFCFEVYGLRIIQASSPDANPADVWTYDVICGNKSRGFSRLVMGRLSLWRILLAFVDVLDLNLWHVFEKNEHYVVLLTSYCCGVAVSVDMTHLRFEMVGNWWHL